MKRIGDNIVWYEDLNTVAVKSNSPDDIAVLAQCNPLTRYSKGSITGFLFTLSDELCQVLINLKYLPAIFMTKFWREPHLKIEGKYQPMAHQLITAAFIIFTPRCYVLSDCRLGKTGSAILAFNYLQRQQIIKGGVLVITTLTTTKSVWARNIHDTLPNNRISLIHDKNSFALLKQPADWYITNYDSVRLHTEDFAYAVKHKLIDAIIIDELTHVGNSTSQRHKAIYYLTQHVKPAYVVGMTGSPGSNPEPVFGMARTVNPAKLPVSSKTAWLDLTTTRIGPFIRRPNDCADNFILKTLQPAIRFKKEDVLDLPPVTHQERTCSLSKEQQEVIKTLRRDCCVLANSGETITVANAGVLLMKLMQAALGFIMTENEELTPLKTGDRDNTILDIINESQAKTVIFSMFRYRLKYLEDFLNKNKISVARIDGGVTGDARSDILYNFSNNPEPKVLVCHPTTVGFGTELSAADTMILDGPPLLGDFSYMQTVERLSSPKQKADHINIITIQCIKEERKFFSRLKQGQMAGAIVGKMFEELKY